MATAGYTNGPGSSSPGTVPDQACIDELGISVDYVTDCDKQTLSEAGGDGDCDAVQWEFATVDPEDCEH